MESGSMRRIHREKVIKAAVGSVCIGILLTGGVFSWRYVLRSRMETGMKSQGCYLAHTMKKNELVTADDLAVFDYEAGVESSYLTMAQAEGIRLLSDTTEGTKLTEDMVYAGEPLTDDMRIHKYTCIKLTDRMQKGDYPVRL
jgi:hypothetical protein